jgi:hypothetical protein
MADDEKMVMMRQNVEKMNLLRGFDVVRRLAVSANVHAHMFVYAWKTREQAVLCIVRAFGSKAVGFLTGRIVALSMSAHQCIYAHMHVRMYTCLYVCAYYVCVHIDVLFGVYALTYVEAH